jgi:hypothetical protein
MPGAQHARAPPFCEGDDNVCFTFNGPPTLRIKSFMSIFDPANAKKQASRISGTQCVKVPKQCGGVGQPCCPGVSESWTIDKPIPSFGTSWRGRPCDDTQSEEGAYCNGAGAPWAGPREGTGAGALALRHP